MILYSNDESPFSAAVRLAVYAKGLDVEIRVPPGGLLSAQYHQINPIGTIPCLMIEDEPLPESLAILEFFEDRYPAVPMLPGTAEFRARTRMLARLAELGVLIPLVRLKAEAGAGAGAAWQTRLVRGLASLNHLLETPRSVDLTLADCFLVPALAILTSVARSFGKANLIDAYPNLRQDGDRLRQNPHVARVRAELTPYWA